MSQSYNNEPILKVSSLKVAIHDRPILRELNFTLSENETLVVLGPNGAGKTILLKALLGILPHQGDVRWKSGINIGYVPQRVPINKELPLSVFDFFKLKNMTRSTSLSILSELGIAQDSFLDRQLGHLSSGLFQRVLIAWALISEPEVLIFDEPTAGIDISGETLLHSLLQRRRAERNISVILVTHDLSTVYSEASHVLCLNGPKYCYGVPQAVLTPENLQKIYGREIRYYRHDNNRLNDD